MKKTLAVFTNKKILYICTFAILIFIPFIKQGSFYLVKFGIINNYDSINTSIIIFLSLPFLIFIYIKDLIKSKRKLDIFDYLIYILILVGFIVTACSINKNLSLFGKYYRHEGLLSLMGYYLLFINWKINATEKDIKIILKLITVIAIVNSIYALFQIYTKFPFILRYTNDRSMASGLCGNPNFFGSLIVTAISIITGKFLIQKSIHKKNILILILLFISLINCQSTGPFLSYIILILFLFIYLIIKKKLILKNLLILIFILVFIFAGTYFLNSYDFSFKDNNGQTKCEMCDLNETIRTGGNGRIEIWKNTLKVVEKRPIIGIGYDNLHLAYPNPPIRNGVTFISTEDGIKAIPISYYVVDNAHNVYLHILATSGILGLLPYLALCLLVFICGLRAKKNLLIPLLSGFVAYSVQAFANISVISVAPIYFIIMGLILSVKK